MPVEVRDTVEFQRVADLPRRRVTESDAIAWGKTFTEELIINPRPCGKCPPRPDGSLGCITALGPWQGYALAEVAANDGGIFGYPVGIGKTLITYLLAVVLGAKRPVLVVPASLVDKTYDDFAAYMRHWKKWCAPINVISRESLSTDAGAAFLASYKPDLFMLDEGDEWGNVKAGGARRIDRFVAKYGGDCVVVILTGTTHRKTIMALWHLLAWTLRADGMPMPAGEEEAKLWALAIDEGKGRDFRNVEPGPLGRDVDEARAWFRKRLVETPGVVMLDGDSAADVPLTVRLRLAKEDPKLDRAFEQFLKFEGPHEEPVTDALSRWKQEGLLGCGLVTYYDPPPPEAWREARRESAKFVRARIAMSDGWNQPLDTEAGVFKRYPDHPIVRAWLDIKDTYDHKKHTRVRWISDSTIQSAREWMNHEPSVIWYGSTDFGQALQTATRLPNYGPGGKDQNGRGLHVADPKKHLLASWHACKKGFNLQAWRRQLIVYPPQSAKWLEQIFGRAHRQGQTRDVEYTILATSGGTLDGFEAAYREAEFVRETTGMTQKLLRANLVRVRPRLNKTNQFRWAQKAY